MGRKTSAPSSDSILRDDERRDGASCGSGIWRSAPSHRGDRELCQSPPFFSHESSLSAAARALVFGNDRLPVEERFQLEAACAQEGLTLEYIGAGYGNPQPRPEIFLLDYDLVFAVGKCAIEALACGCAVIPLIAGQAGQLITPLNFFDWAQSNFCPPYYFGSAAQVNPGWLQEELREFTAEGIVEVSSRLRAEHNLGRTVDALEALYQTSVQEHVSGTADRENRELVSYLEARGIEIDGMYLDSSQFGLLRERIHELERDVRLLRLKNQALRLSLIGPARRVLS
jgi:hypothetical protein